MSQATDRTKQAEANYKKIFKIRLVERKQEQYDKNLINRELQTIGIKNAMQRKIVLRRSR